MKILLYEFATGGGLLASGDPSLESLLSEGAAMIAALAADFTALDGVDVLALCDHRFDHLELDNGRVYTVRDAQQERNTLQDLATRADWTMVIAPELDNLLLERVAWVEAAGGRLLGPSSRVVAVAADKQRTAERLKAAGVPVPEGCRLDPGQPLPAGFPYPAVLKPLDGAGSVGVTKVTGPAQPVPAHSKSQRLERFCRGTAASVSLLCGPNGRYPLPACRQKLSRDGRFQYKGGSLPLSSPLGRRAVELACLAVEALEAPRGYLGVDLVLGEDRAGSEDVVVEINPRLTTSYVGLRAATNDNLAAAMLTWCMGGRISLAFRSAPLHFTPDGQVRS